MSANSFGRLFKVSTFGESHGKALGALIEGCPSGVEFDEDLLRENLRRRRPGQSKITTSRDEADEPTLLSGVYLSKTLGTPIAIVVNNRDADSSAYTDELLKTRAGHATDLWQEKFGHSDPRGSGRASGRETLARVLGGSVAQMALRSLVPGLKTFAFVSQVGPIFLDRKRVCELADRIFNSEVLVDQYLSRFPDKNGSENVEVMLEQAKIEGESYGGVIELFIYNTPKGLGQPVFKKMKSEMASALMGIGAVNSVSVG
ncbi:MAG: chorismate synthase, partial [Bdellovibrionales bacterium]|nr:chorismate synthase [Bdellovibrionales bacterium]